jgi:signal peptidase II
MTALVTALLLVVLIDQALKLLVLHKLGPGSISLGLLGSVRTIQTQMWLVRASRRGLVLIWSVWAGAACLLAVAHNFLPSSAWFCGLLLGGSLSHLLETATRGSICDYVCLHFWPAFNFADVAIMAGAIGLLFSIVGAIG